MQKKTIAKAVAWIAAALGTLAAAKSFGKYNDFVLMVTPGIAGYAAHLASETSAGHPNG